MSNLREWLETARNERWGILTDLAFAVVWVTMVEALFQVVTGPTWAYYGLVASSALATTDE